MIILWKSAFVAIIPGNKWPESAKTEGFGGQRRRSGPLCVCGNTRYSSWLHGAPHQDSDPEWGQPHLWWELWVSDQPAWARHGSLRGSGWRLHWGWVHRLVSGESLKMSRIHVPEMCSPSDRRAVYHPSGMHSAGLSARTTPVSDGGRTSPCQAVCSRGTDQPKRWRKTS